MKRLEQRVRNDEIERATHEFDRYEAKIKNLETRLTSCE